MHGDSVLNYMAVNWYGMNSIYFDPDTGEQDKGMTFATRMKLKSAKYEDEFDGFGFPGWKPSQRLIDTGYIHDDAFFKE